MAVLVSHTTGQKKLIYFLVVAVFAFILIKNVEATTNADNISNRNKDDNSKKPFENHTHLEQQKTFKKELKVNLTDLDLEPITEPIDDDDHTEKLIVIDANSVIETESKAIVQPITPQNQTPVASKVKEEKTTDRPPIAIPTKLSTTVVEKPKHHEEEKYLTKGEDDISDSLKTGFYFFLILSSGAIFFIMFKIYRLRLSRAERRYGVQGDRTTQELTPLPTSIEDGHSDDEDQTVFEVQRQNIRIL